MKDSKNIFLNLACGVKTHPDWVNLDMSPYIFLRHNMRLAKILKLIGFLSDQRWARLNAIPVDVQHINLKNGIPYEAASVDVIYHSHFLEHLPKSSVPSFLKECFRVLKPRGIMRIVVPDLQYIMNEYLESCAMLKGSDDKKELQLAHEKIIYNLFENMVRDYSAGAKEQKKWVRIIEQTVRGGADKTGELHRWMYDEFTIDLILKESGFTKSMKQTFNTSLIENFTLYGLDNDATNNEYKPGSLYIEAIKD